MFEEGHTIWVNNWEDPDIEIVDNGGNVSVLVVLGEERPSHVFGDLLWNCEPKDIIRNILDYPGSITMVVIHSRA